MCYTTESYEDDVSVLRQINPNIIALDEKTLEAERRSYHTFFDVHVVETRDGYILIEEGDYGELPMHLIDQIVYTATGKWTMNSDETGRWSSPPNSTKTRRHPPSFSRAEIATFGFTLTASSRRTIAVS